MQYCNIILLLQISVLLYQEVVSYKLSVSDDVKNFQREEDFFKLPKNGELFEGDMIMNDRLRDAIIGRKRTALSADLASRWKDGIIVYVNNITNVEGRRLFKKAREEFERRTCIKFKKRTDENDYVVYTDKKDYCASDVGFRGGKQIANIGVNCNVLGTFIHETMHVLGFVHEHSRPDRDEHVKIKWDNILKDNSFNFNKYQWSDVAKSTLPYNFASLMHYPNNAFTSNGENTIIAKHDPSLMFGQRIKFSVGDVKGINMLYNCKKKNDYIGLYDTFDEISIQQQRDLKMREYHEKIRDLFY